MILSRPSHSARALFGTACRLSYRYLWALLPCVLPAALISSRVTVAAASRWLGAVTTSPERQLILAAWAWALSSLAVAFATRVLLHSENRDARVQPWSSLIGLAARLPALLRLLVMLVLLAIPAIAIWRYVQQIPRPPLHWQAWLAQAQALAKAPTAPHVALLASPIELLLLVWFAYRLALVTPIVAAEKVGILTAMGMSWERMGGRVGKLFWAHMLVFAAAGATWAGLLQACRLAGHPVEPLFFAPGIAFFFSPLRATVDALLYMQLRPDVQETRIQAPPVKGGPSLVPVFIMLTIMAGVGTAALKLWPLLHSINELQKSNLAQTPQIRNPTEGLWFDSGATAQFRVIRSVYLPAGDHVEFVVAWQVKNVSHSALKLNSSDMVISLRDGTEIPPSVHGEAGESDEALAPGATSEVLLTYYVIPQKELAGALRWVFTVGGHLLFGVQLHPYAVGPGQLFEHPEPVEQLAPSTAIKGDPGEPNFSILRSSADHQDCEWFSSSGGKERLLARVKHGCSYARIALSPDQQTAVVSQLFAPYEVNLATGQQTFVPRPPGPPNSSEIVGYDERGKIIAVVQNSELEAGHVSAYRFRTLTYVNGSWQAELDTTAKPGECSWYWGFDNPVARQWNCRLIHLGTQPGECAPALRSRSQCETPQWRPLDPNLSSQLAASALPTGQGWTRVSNPASDIVTWTGIATGGSNLPELVTPVYFLRDAHFDPVRDLAHTGGSLAASYDMSTVTVATQGPYVLLGNPLPVDRRDTLGLVNRPHRYWVYDLRSRSVVRTFDKVVEVAFWPRPIQGAAASQLQAQLVALPPDTRWVKSADGSTHQSFVRNVRFTEREYVSDPNFIDVCRDSCLQNPHCQGFFAQTLRCPDPRAHDHRSNPYRKRGKGCFHKCGFFDRGDDVLNGELGGDADGAVWLKAELFAGKRPPSGFFTGPYAPVSAR